LDEGKFPDICHTGTGSFKIRSEMTLDEESCSITVESIPYHVKLDDVKDKINSLRSSSLSPLIDMFDGTDFSGINLYLKFAPGTDLKAMQNVLYKKTALESVFATQMTYVDMERGELSIYNLKEVMMRWIENRRIVKRKMLNNKLVMGKKRLHVLDIVIDICEDKKLLEKVIQLIRKSRKEEVVKLLHEKYDISSIQAIGIANMRIIELSKTAHDEYVEERKNLKKEVADIEAKVNSIKKIDADIIEELESAIKKYNKPRRCQVVKYKPDDDLVSSVSNTNHILVFTKNGFVKKLDANATEIGELNPGDDPISTRKVNNRDTIIVFDSKGFCHPIKVSDIAVCDTKAKGITLSTYARISGQVVSIIPQKDIKKNSFFIFLTKNGMIKKTECDKFAFKTSVISIALKNDDELVSVIHGNNKMDIIVFTKNGYGIRFSTETISPTSRISSGVIGMDISTGDNIIGIAEVKSSDTHIMIMSSKGMGKVCDLDSFPITKRRGDVLILSKLTGSDELVDVIPCNAASRFLIVMINDSMPLDFNDFSELTRAHYGKKMVSVRRGDKIIRCIKLK
jgi:DNA gyrase subunit A